MTGNPYPSMEEIVRPWVSVVSYSTPRTLPPPAEVLPEAFIRWGAASQFNVDGSFRENANNPYGFHTRQPPDEPGASVTYTEEGRTVSVVRVVNPADNSQFIDVELINAISFRGPGGISHIFQLRN